MRHRSAALVVTAVVWGLWPATSPARGAEVRLSAPASLVAGSPCRAAVTVGSGVRGTSLLQHRRGRRWRTVATARLTRRSVTLRCPTAERPGHMRLRALVRRNGRTIARSRTVSIEVVPRPVLVPGRPPPKPAGPSPLPGTPAPLDPAQFGVEGTGGAPSPEALALVSNPNVVLDAEGIADIRAGRIDPRVVAVLTTLSRTHRITVSAMCSDHPKFTSGGSVSTHYYGRAMDIAAVDDVPVTVTNAKAREVAGGLSSLDRSYRPDEVGSPWAISAPGYFTDAANQDKIHVGFKQPIDPSWTPPPV
jgi:hypothetical protein